MLRSHADRVQLADKEVELKVCDLEECQLEYVELMFSDRYISKRDLWHFLVALMQDSNQVLYSGVAPPLVIHFGGNAHISQLGAVGRTVFSGVAGSKTKWNLRSGSAAVFLLVQVSAELWHPSLSGRPYWDAL